MLVPVVVCYGNDQDIVLSCIHYTCTFYSSIYEYVNTSWKTFHCFMTGLSSPSGEGVIGIGLDSCVMRTRHSGIFLIQTTDLYPIL